MRILALDGHFSEEKEYCRNRVEVAYNSAAGIANVWLNFLSFPKQAVCPKQIETRSIVIDGDSGAVIKQLL